MSLSLKIIFGIAAYYIILGAILGNLGVAIASEAPAANSTLSQFEGYNSSTEVGLTTVTSFWEGLAFSIDNMPWWVEVFLLGVMPVGAALGVVWLLRGNG